MSFSKILYFTNFRKFILGYLLFNLNCLSLSYCSFSLDMLSCKYFWVFKLIWTFLLTLTDVLIPCFMQVMLGSESPPGVPGLCVSQNNDLFYLRVAHALQGRCAVLWEYIRQVRNSDLFYRSDKSS